MKNGAAMRAFSVRFPLGYNSGHYTVHIFTETVEISDKKTVNFLWYVTVPDFTVKRYYHIQQILVSKIAIHYLSLQLQIPQES